MKENLIVEKSYYFAVKIVKLYKDLAKNKKEYILTKQILRSGTSIGANVAEAQRGQSKKDFAAKMAIALKEANETEYWLRLLYDTEYLSQETYESLKAEIKEIIYLLTAICKTANSVN